MSKFKHSVAGLALAAVTGTGAAFAQQNPPQTLPGQPVQQTPPVQTQQDLRGVNQGNNQGNQQSVSVEQALVMKMKKMNDAEIELAQLAQEKVDDQNFRQFTQTLIQDHQALNQQLDQVAGAAGGNAGNRRAGQNNQDQNNPGQNQNNPGQNQVNPGQNQADAGGQLGNQPTNSAQPGRQGQGRGQMPGMGGGRVPQMLISIASQACDNNLKMTKEMLNKYDGQDLKMAFLGQQIVAHTASLAEMKAIESSGPEKLKGIAQQASPKIQEHLETAKKLAKKFEDDRDTGSRSSEDSKSDGNDRK